MDDQLLAQLLGSVEATAGAPVEQYDDKFFAMPPAARLETLKLRKAGGKLDKTGEALLSLLSRRVERETPSRLQPGNRLPVTEESLIQSLQGMDPLAPLRTQQYQ